MDGEKEQKRNANGERRLPHINLRPLLVCALAMAAAISLYTGVRFHTFSFAQLVFPVLFFLIVLFPFSLRRAAAVALALVLFLPLGAAVMHFKTQDYFSAPLAGEHRVMGTASTVTVERGYTNVVLSDLFVDGAAYAGKCSVILSERVRPGDIVVLSADIESVAEDEVMHGYAQYLFVSDIRYRAAASEEEITGTSGNPFLRLNAALYDLYYAHMQEDEASFAYALVTGNMGGMDDSLLSVVRYGNIAHIFAVSGMHIGVLFSAMYLLCRPFCRRWAFLPAIIFSASYCALCAFTVSSVRSLIMCAVFGLNRFWGRKTDMLESLSLAAILVFLFSPMQWYSIGFRLSFGACVGLALFSGSFSRLCARGKIPAVIGSCLSATVAAQLFTLPVMLEAFGYLSVWGVLVNVFVVPFVTALFFGLLICTALALVIPPAAAFFLIFPESLLSLMLFLLSVVDITAVLSGFTLGAGAVVWIAGACALCQRMRLSRPVRACAALGLSVLFACCLLYENAVFTGCRILVYRSEERAAALIQTKDEAVLVIDGDITLSDCTSFLDRSYGGTLSAVVVLCEDEVEAINRAIFLPGEEVRALYDRETGLQTARVLFGDAFSYGTLSFVYEGSKLLLFTEDIAVEFDFEGKEALSADLFVGGEGTDLQFYIRDGIIRAR